MPWMSCPPGAAFQILAGTHYVDDGSGRVEVSLHHVDEVRRMVGWTVIPDDVVPAGVQVDVALDKLEAGIAAESESVEALVEEAMAQVPAERAAEARAEAHAAVLAEPEVKEAKDEEPHHEAPEAPQAHQDSPRREAPQAGARGDPRSYPTYRPPRR